MRIKQIFFALVACMAFAASAANAAKAEQWTVGEEGTVLSGEETVRIAGGPWALSSSILGMPITLHSESVSCSGFCTISGEGRGEGRLSFTGVTVEPGTCTASSPFGGWGTMDTEPLALRMIMSGESVAARVEPIYFNIAEIEFSGAECPLSEAVVPLRGSADGEAAHPTGVLAVDQTLEFTSVGSALWLGKESATLEGTMHMSLSGGLEGAAFGVDE